ncbi:phosphotransferase family protein [Streptomyces sp. NPDC001880]
MVLGGRQHVRRSTERGVDIVVKGLRNGDGFSPRGLFLEAALQSAAASCYTAEGPGIVPVTPPLRCTGEHLTLRFHADELPLDRLFGTPAALDRAAGATGRTIAVLHSKDVSGPGWAWLPRVAGEHPFLEPIPLAVLGDLAEGTVELAAELHRQGFAEILAGALGEEDDRRVFLHGDLKFDNILATADGADVRLIDWECAGWGIPERDLGALVASLLAEAMRRAVTESSGDGPAASLALIDTETEKAWSAASALLSSYRSAPGAPTLKHEALIHMTAFALLCRAQSYTSSSHQFDRFPKLLVKAASRMAQRPHLFQRRFS